MRCNQNNASGAINGAIHNPLAVNRKIVGNALGHMLRGTAQERASHASIAVESISHGNKRNAVHSKLICKEYPQNELTCMHGRLLYETIQHRKVCLRLLPHRRRWM